jgi:hypothetical protein
MFETHNSRHPPRFYHPYTDSREGTWTVGVIDHRPEVRRRKALSLLFWALDHAAAGTGLFSGTNFALHSSAQNFDELDRAGRGKNEVDYLNAAYQNLFEFFWPRRREVLPPL